MITTLYLVRHAKSVAIERGIVQGAGLSVPLSEEGIAQAKRLAEKLRGEKIDRIFASNALRAIDTAKPIREIFPDIPYEECSELNERSKGIAEGMTHTEFEKKYPEVLSAWKREEDPKPAGGESFTDVEKRVMPLINEHMRSYSGKRILYVFHGNAIANVLGAVLGVPPHLRHRITQDYCAVNIIEHDSETGRWKVVKVNS